MYFEIMIFGSKQKTMTFWKQDAVSKAIYWLVMHGSCLINKYLMFTDYHFWQWEYSGYFHDWNQAWNILSIYLQKEDNSKTRGSQGTMDWGPSKS